ncbi:MAG: hypothetical protein M1396_05405, partial [Chloroflexi bacterium]|nr:hypothetical protein [Chloroflexota bacterium]
ELFRRFPFTEQAKDWLRKEITLVIQRPQSTSGGGFWHPDRRMVELLTCQYEAAIHEYAHAWWHERRLRDQNAVRLMVAVVHLSEEKDPTFAVMAHLAHGYVYGIETQRDEQSPTGYWRGMLAEGSDWEMYAGLASGCMADIRLLPPYVRQFYEELFVVLPMEAPSRLEGAPHR